MPSTKWIITCEHGGNDIPKLYQPLFNKAEAVLKTHRGLDIGALNVAKALAAKLADFHQFTTISRLLIELNRTQGRPNLWSEFTKDLPTETKQIILDTYYFPYRNTVENYIAQTIKAGDKIIHLSIHSFTPSLNGIKRNAEIGLLYDPARQQEKAFCLNWQSNLQALQPTWRIRRNSPYQGTSDGFTTYLRKCFTAKNYIGIELEMNQALLQKSPDTVKQTIICSLC